MKYRLTTTLTIDLTTKLINVLKVQDELLPMDAFLVFV